MSKKNNYIIAVCNKLKINIAENNHKNNNIEVIFNGIEKIPNKVNNKNNLIRKEFEIDEKDFLFVTLTRLSEEKGLFFLLDSLKFLKTLIQIPFRILVVGNGDLKQKLIDHATKHEIDNIVIFTGFRSDTHEILNCCDCYVNSSFSECLSFGILEALSQGLPIIATKVGGNEDIINEQTNCGILVRYNSIVQMSKAMEKMISNKTFYKNCSQNAMLAIEEKFSLDNMYQQTLEIYKTCLNQ